MSGRGAHRLAAGRCARLVSLLFAGALAAAPAPAQITSSSPRPDAPASPPVSGRAVREIPALSDAEWGALVRSLSEESGFFDTDNLISNERSYLHVIGPLRRMRGGAYLGVGPDQNFSYIAALRPAIAFVVDIRRDNLLQHVLLRSLFALSSSRMEFLTRLHGRPLPANPRAWEGGSLDEILAHVDALPADSGAVRSTRAAIEKLARALPIGISDADVRTIQRFHGEFIRNGTALRFQTFGRVPRPGYPTYRQLLLETDAAGRPASFMADEESFRRVKEMEEKNLVVPVVGDLAGPKAVRAIGAWLAQREIGVTAYYTSNVEDYVWRDGKYPAFVDDVRALPWASGGVIVRSYFRVGRAAEPALLVKPGYYSSQILQPIEAFLQAAGEAARGRASYERVITAGALELR